MLQTREEDSKANRQTRISLYIVREIQEGFSFKEQRDCDPQEPVEGIDSPGQNHISDLSYQPERIASDSHSGGESYPLDPANGPANQRGAPYQPSDVWFPSRQLGRSLRSFRSEWFVGRPWLEYSVKLDSAFCFPCRLFAASHPGCGERTFTHTQGFATGRMQLRDSEITVTHFNLRFHNHD